MSDTVLKYLQFYFFRSGLEDLKIE